MIAIAAWQVWIILGIIFIIIEIFDPAFFFIALGFGAILTGLLCLLHFVNANIPLQIILFALFSFIAFLFTRKIGKKVLAHTGGETNVYALKGKTGFVTKDIPAEGKGYVKIGGEEWVAVAGNKAAIAQNSKVVVMDIEGNKLVVEVTS